MSHFTKLSKAQVTDPKAFMSTCAELGMQPLEGKTLPGYRGNQMTVAHGAVIGQYGIGLTAREDGKFDMVADWWGIRTALPGRFRNDQDLQDYVLKHTTKHALVNTYRKQGFRATYTEDAEQNINLVLQRY